MIIESLKSLYNRDLNKLKLEIGSYKSEESIWKIDKNILNSGGNLCLHLLGNLNTYIGAELGNSGYVRHRDLEFSSKDIPKTELLEKIKSLIEIVDSTLNQLSDEDLKKDYPTEALGYKMTTGYFLIHLLSHLDYHLGQINYHRRLLDI
ncbi:putative damage-inducible protein DinB [Epilithonimonas hungarica]|uniref:DinB family protein n=1 Tax=Epilithonimonas hungarica TaxID=454006 RepID=UPI002782BDC2|nr:DinB family protein [Epilithonimonas hungarica]MDP9957409.1 putative damage-inducible protein DinB [Epilithonimonas hungarica]